MILPNKSKTHQLAPLLSFSHSGARYQGVGPYAPLRSSACGSVTTLSNCQVHGLDSATDTGIYQLIVLFQVVLCETCNVSLEAQRPVVVYLRKQAYRCRIYAREENPSDVAQGVRISR